MNENNRLPLSVFLLLGLALMSPAQTLPTTILLPGDVFDGQGGPFLANRVYTSLGGFRVPAGETLTIQPGAIIKFGFIPGLVFTVLCRLIT